MKPAFLGSGVAMTTPFTKDDVDFEALGRAIARQIDAGTQALVVLGTTGEPSTMTNQERERVIKYALAQARGRVPVIVGTGTNDTRETIDRSQMAQELGAHHLLIVTPYYNKATQSGLIRHYSAIAQNVRIPILLYNVPARTGLNMLPETVRAIAENERVVGLKEAADDIRQIDRDIELFGDRLAIYSGNDDTAYPAMALGAQGVISVTANVTPGLVSDMAQSCLRGDCHAALRVHRKLARLNRLLFCEVNPIPVKAALGMMGMDRGIVRLPLTSLSEPNRAALRAELLALELITT